MSDKGHCMINLDLFDDEYVNFLKHKANFTTNRAPLSQKIAVKVLEEEKRKKEVQEEESGPIEEEKEVPKSESNFSLLSETESFSFLNEQKSESGTGTSNWEEINNEASNNELSRENSLGLSELSIEKSTKSEIDDQPMILENGELLLPNGKM